MFKSSINSERAQKYQWPCLALHVILLAILSLTLGPQTWFLFFIILVGTALTFIILAIEPGSPKERKKLIIYGPILIAYAMLIRNVNLRLITPVLPIDDFMIIILILISVVLFFGWSTNREHAINAFDLLVEKHGIGVFFSRKDPKRAFFPLSSISSIKIKEMRTMNFSMSKSVHLIIKKDEEPPKKITLCLLYVDKDLRRQEGICRQIEMDLGLGARPQQWEDL